MRHGMVNRKLGRTSAHRAAMFRNQLASLIDKERIITTLPKAKELRPLIERLITLGKIDNVHNRRQAARLIGENEVAKLFDTLGPRFSERPGGYTRIIKLGSRRGDAAEMAILEFVGYELPQEASAPAETPKKQAKAKKDVEAPADGDEKPKRAPKAKAAKKSEEPAGEDKPKKKAAAKPAAKAPAKKKSK
jgi:large subunit ribosomal protein L17